MRESRIPALGPRGEGWTTLQILLMLGIVFAAWRAPLTPTEPGPLSGLARDAGGALLIFALALIASSTWLLRRSAALSALPRPLESGSLVSSGPYRLVRHPIYAGLVLAGIAISLIQTSPLAAVLTLALFALLDLKRRREEAWLLERFPAYAAYRNTTKALIPFLY